MLFWPLHFALCSSKDDDINGFLKRGVAPQRVSGFVAALIPGP